MAIKPTIYKFNIQLSDMDRAVYDDFNLTVAQHPSETLVRMCARVLGFCINSAVSLEFTKGVSAVDEPDLWLKEMNDEISLWIDVGEPSIERIKKASHRASEVRIYSFNTKSEIWWSQVSRQVESLGVKTFRFPFAELEQLVELIQRTNQMSVTISEQSAGIALNEGYCEVGWQPLS